MFCDAGLTVGVLPFEKIQLETGFEYMETGTNSLADSGPMYFNAKLGTPENSIAKGSPSFVVGGYNFGTKTGVATQNNGYALFAKTLPSLGRFSAGWDRTMTEISDKLWTGGKDTFTTQLDINFPLGRAR